MRWSKLFIPTLRDAPSDAEAASHKLLIRAGFIRQLHAGHYSMLPLGHKVHTKVANIVRDEMDKIGGQEFFLPAMHPAGIWHQSGRWEVMGDELFRLTDRHGAEIALGMTHEEIFATVGTELTSYKQLPQFWYQIQTKFRDEPRPKSGLLRVREFAMKDSYSFDIDEAGLDESFDHHFAAYNRIFERLHLPTMSVEASSGSMGGSDSIEFMVPSPAGEDDVIHCPNCDYAANVERANAQLDEVDDPADSPEIEKFATPGVTTIAELEAFEGGAPANRQLKTLVMIAEDETVLAVVRGDHHLNLQKLADALGVGAVRPAVAEETVAALGANPGSLGAVGDHGLRIVIDHALKGRTNMTTGANEDGFHIRNVDVDRDIADFEWQDLREVSAGEPCINCGTALLVTRCIETGHIFKLGRQYTEVMGVSVLDENGKTQIPIMGSYGIGVGRAMAAAVETFHDDKGIIWPVSIAPYEVIITLVNVKDDASVAAGNDLYDQLKSRGVDVLIDDRNARAGVKFADAELIGVPFRITVGPRTLGEGNVEFSVRSEDESSNIAIGDVVDHVVGLVEAGR